MPKVSKSSKAKRAGASQDPKAKTAYHHGDLRSGLLDAAVEVIQQRGVHGLSLRECARRLGVSHAAPYRHFKSKDALLVALVGQGFRWLVDAGKEAMSAVDDPRAQMDAYGVAYVHFALRRPVHHRLMFASELDGSLASSDDLVASQEAFLLLHESAQHTVGPNDDSMLAAYAFWSMVHGISMLILDGRIPPERIATKAQVTALTESMFRHWRQQGSTS